MPLTADALSACLVRAIEATVYGDSSSVNELFTADVVAWSPTVSVTSRVELAVELEDHEDAFSEIEVRTSPVISGRHRASAEWVVTATHSGPLTIGDGPSRGADRPPGHPAGSDGGGLRRRSNLRGPALLG